MIPQRKPSPPERAAISGMLLKGEAEEEDDVDELFLLQQITLCLPLASMAQKKPLSPNAAEIGPIDPNPDATATRRSKRKEISGRERQRSKGVRICIGRVGFGSGVSWTRRRRREGTVMMLDAEDDDAAGGGGVFAL